MNLFVCLFSVTVSPEPQHGQRVLPGGPLHDMAAGEVTLPGRVLHDMATGEVILPGRVLHDMAAGEVILPGRVLHDMAAGEPNPSTQLKFINTVKIHQYS